MKTIRQTKSFQGKTMASKIVAVMIGAMGFVFCQPFIWAVMVFGEHQPYMSFARFMWICIFIVGLPMFFYGIIAFFAAGKSGTTSVSNDQSDMSRIRYAVEMERMNRR
jgi:hypothetical protein